MAHLDEQLAKIREFTARSKRNGAGSFNAFRDLISFLLHQTIAKPAAVISLNETKREPREAVIGGIPKAKEGILLNNGHFLRITMSLYLDKDHLKIAK